MLPFLLYQLKNFPFLNLMQYFILKHLRKSLVFCS